MRVTPRRLARGMSLWIPNLFSGIRVKRFADDWTSATVELHVNVFTRNYVKTAFGGSMSAMTDPYYFMLVRHQLGREYMVWDTRGEIEFLKPGRGVLTAHFEVPPPRPRSCASAPAAARRCSNGSRPRSPIATATSWRGCGARSTCARSAGWRGRRRHDQRWAHRADRADSDPLESCEFRLIDEAELTLRRRPPSRRETRHFNSGEYGSATGHRSRPTEGRSSTRESPRR